MSSTVTFVCFALYLLAGAVAAIDSIQSGNWQYLVLWFGYGIAIFLWRVLAVMKGEELQGKKDLPGSDEG